MKVLHLCTYDTGGAANAALRLHEGLLETGEQSYFASKAITHAGKNHVAVMKEKGDWLVRHSTSVEFHLAQLLRPFVKPVFTKGLLPACGLRALATVQPELLNLHWVEHGMISVRDLAYLSHSGIPFVWTLHDMAPLTGGFGYREAVGLPAAAFGPTICTGKNAQASSRIQTQRQKALRGARLTIIAPSTWLAEEAKRSPVFSAHRVEHIPYGIDTSVFRPMNRDAARKKWDLPEDSIILLFGADTFEDPRKGIHHLKAALERMTPTPPGKSLLLVGFGNKSPLEQKDFCIPVKGIGRLNEAEHLAELYSAADVFICPSREDNLPNTMVESLACGTPVVGFQIGGLLDLVRENETGSLAAPYDEEALAKSLENVLYLSTQERLKMRATCRKLAEDRLTIKNQALAYATIYRELLEPLRQEKIYPS